MLPESDIDKRYWFELWFVSTRQKTNRTSVLCGHTLPNHIQRKSVMNCDKTVN